ncbi:UvrD-helicase domain-containing protein [uncultured Treponema sp.]|uniref:ATP-dependent helicase n=1 Tax=uncultured Treponema sp. TaxID=162155 RepID=UPI002596FC90|nr:UvrD-helicase domain-containing protein [uncultured Treponema sp.]
MNAEDYLSVLNKEQREAVEHEGSPLLILAGAGSGKTRVITTKIAYMISELGINPASILAVTFTKKAAEEMKERAINLEPCAQKSHIRTFHSFGAWFLRLCAEDSGIGIQNNFTVYDDDNVCSLISNAIPSLTKKDASHYAKKIALAKDYCLLPGDLELSRICDEPIFPEVYEKYQQRLRKTGNVDFGDLILLPYLILKENDLIRKSFHARYKVILVDEYQDSNVAQFKLLQELSGVNENSGTYVCVVGDDDQSIYKFRGAEIQNILNFKDEFPGTKIIRLETNYRSTSEILNCAGNVVRNNSGRLGKELVSARGKGKKPALVFLPSQDDETEFCYSLIEQAYEHGIPYSDWAILYRTNAQSLGFETEFLHKKIPYEVVGSLKFYEREEVKDIISWLSFIVNQRDEISFRRIVNKPVRGIGNTTQDKIIEASDGNSILNGAESLKLSKKAKEGFDFFKSLVEKFSDELPNLPVTSEAALLAGQAINENNIVFADEKKLSEFVEKVVKESGLEEFHKDQDEEIGTQKIENLQELVNSAVLYPCTKQGLLDFLDHINLDRTLKTESEEEKQEDKVTLITLHNTKGLEFKRVIITGMESGIFPREGKTESELEEERRLFYVGITRAKDELYFTSCGVRRLFGRTNFMIPSPFLAELGNEIRILGQKPDSFSASRTEKSPLEKKYCMGACVFHDDYGHGQIIRSSYSDEGEYVVTVSFETGGIKKFLPKYQKNSLLVEDDL